jgi:hypothetical protein
MVTDDKLIYAFTMTSGSIFPSTMTYVQGLLFGYNDDTLVSGALASVISTLNKHISSPDAHPQYLKKELFAQFLEMLVPVGYEYKTWEDNSPKQLFDSILGKETYWRKLRGVISVAVDENDPNINKSGLILGKKGDAVNLVGSPDVYPLYTKNVYERYDPSTVINTVWTITANKNPVTEGESVTFTVKANNISDGIEVSYTVKEGTLSNNAIVTPVSYVESSTITRYLANTENPLKSSSVFKASRGAELANTWGSISSNLTEIVDLTGVTRGLKATSCLANVSEYFKIT